MTSVKCLLAPIAVVAALSLAACGGSSTLSSDQFTGLQDQAKQFAQSMQTVGADATSCADGSSAGNGSATPPDLHVVESCLASALAKAQTSLSKIIGYTANLTSAVDGACSTDLKAFGGAMTDVKASFAQAEAEVRERDLVKMQQTLTAVDAGAITTAGAAAEKSCQP